MSSPIRHAYIDESSRPNGKKRYQGYYLAVTIVPTTHQSGARQSVRQALPAGRSSMHFTKEDTRTRKRFIDAITEPLITASARTLVYYDAQSKDSIARPRLLETFIEELPSLGVHRVNLEQRENHQNTVDRQVFAQQLKKIGATSISYDHIPPTEPLLWIPDALAWCCGRDGWRTIVLDTGLVEIVPKKR